MYAITEKKKATGRVLISVLPPPMPDGSYWLEGLDTANEGQLPVAMRLLAKGNPSHASAIERVIVYIAGQNLVRDPLPMQTAADLQKQPDNKTGATSGAPKITTTHDLKLKVRGRQLYNRSHSTGQRARRRPPSGARAKCHSLDWSRARERLGPDH